VADQRTGFVPLPPLLSCRGKEILKKILNTSTWLRGMLMTLLRHPVSGKLRNGARGRGAGADNKMGIVTVDATFPLW
jgi:hypothetical protein